MMIDNINNIGAAALASEYTQLNTPAAADPTAVAAFMVNMASKSFTANNKLVETPFQTMQARREKIEAEKAEAEKNGNFA